MQKIDNLKDEAKQKISIILDNGETIIFNFNYKLNQEGWFMSIEYKTFILKNIRICISINILRQYKNILPFGLLCVSNDKIEPLEQTAFSSGRVELIVLNAEEVLSTEEFLKEPIKIDREFITKNITPPWILETGFWNDSGIWKDDAIWID